MDPCVQQSLLAGVSCPAQSFDLKSESSPSALTQFPCQAVVNVSICSALGRVPPVYYPKCTQAMTLLPFSSTPCNSINFPLLPMNSCNIRTIQRTEGGREVDVHGGGVPSLGSGTGTRVSRKCRGRLPGSWGLQNNGRSSELADI